MNKEIITLKSNYEDQIWKHNEECRKFKSQVEGLKVDFDRSNYEKNEKSAKLEEAEQKYQNSEAKLHQVNTESSVKIETMCSSVNKMKQKQDEMSKQIMDKDKEIISLKQNLNTN